MVKQIEIGFGEHGAGSSGLKKREIIWLVIRVLFKSLHLQWYNGALLPWIQQFAHLESVILIFNAPILLIVLYSVWALKAFSYMPHSTHIHVLLSKPKHFLPNVHTLLLWYCIYFNSKAHRVRVLNLPACSSDIVQIPQRRPMASIFKQPVYSVPTYISLHSCKHCPVPTSETCCCHQIPNSFLFLP